MKQMTDKEAVSLFKEARRLASVCLNATNRAGLPDSAEVSQVACAFMTAGLVSGKKSAFAVDHAGADSQQDELLQSDYESR